METEQDYTPCYLRDKKITRLSIENLKYSTIIP